MKARDDFLSANFAFRFVLFIRLEKKIDDLKEDDEEKSRNENLPEWIGEFPDDPAKVETKAGRVAVNARQVKLATGEGWWRFHYSTLSVA
jgi:hypothetical protein